ncbi:ankyrin repeat-containing domain protein [Aspergillus karnatakaensis]|uniref:ankyrin repeat domain-containing protein n=1 Tax=Aspergillus karnatakaensis TaxID=1810916 RepID=UPI003CCD415C
MSLTPQIGGETTDMDVESANDLYEVWTQVNVRASVSNNGDDEVSSLVIVSRSGSPSIEFLDVHTAAIPPRIVWPLSLPWFQLRDILEDTVRTKLANAPFSREIQALTLTSLPPTKAGETLTIGSTSVSLMARSGAVEAATKAIGKTMPELFPGEHQARMQLVASGGNNLDAKVEAFHVLCYQLSNKLIEDPNYYDDEDYDENSDKNAQTVMMFRELDLPPDLWTEVFVKQKTRTGAAAAEALFEAAINEGDLKIITTLLKSGVIDPNEPVSAVDGMQFPIQWAASRIDRRGHSDVIRLLVELGADVNEWTEDYSASALFDVARSGSLEMVRLLVEKGADFRDILPNDRDYFCMETPLIAVVYNKQPPQNDSGCSGRHADNDKEDQEPESVMIFRYLLSLHGDTEEDRDIIQEALIAAAVFGRTDLIPLALDAGAELQAPGRKGFTALQAASGSYGDKSAAVRQLLALSARPKVSGLSELHLAALRSSPNTMRALIEHGMDVNMWIPGLTERQLEFLGRFLMSDAQEEFSKIAHLLHTPLDFALAATVYVSDKDRELNAVVLLHAGAKLTGGELVRAIKFNNDELLNCILAQEPDINQRWCGLTVLQACLDSGALGTAEKLVRRGARLTGGEVSAAFEKGTPEFISTLLALGGSLGRKGESAPSPLARACAKQNWPVVEWALQQRLVDYSPGALCATVCLTRWKSDRRLEQINLLLHHRTRVLHHYNPIWSLLEGTAVGYAALCDEEDILDLLLPLGDLDKCIIPMNSNNLVALLSWEYDWVTEQYSKLDWTKPGQPTVSILVPAILSRCWEIVGLLLKKGCKADGFSLLATIRFFDNDQVTQLLSSGGARADTRLKDFDSPLQLAARLGRVEIVRTLLAYGANVNDPPAATKTHWSLPRTALQAATETGSQELIDLLLEAGADVNGPPAPDGGATALQLAAIKGYLPIAQRLLDAGAQIDAKRARVAGRTALEGAAEHGRLDMAQFLLEKGARTFDEGACQYHRAMGFARKKGHRAVLQLLEDWDQGDMESFWSDWDGLLEENFQGSDADAQKRAAAKPDPSVLAPVSIDIKLGASVRRVRDTMTFATRLVEISQKTGTAYNTLFCLMARHFETRQAPEGTGAQNLTGMAKKQATTQDSLPKMKSVAGGEGRTYSEARLWNAEGRYLTLHEFNCRLLF